MKKQYFIYTLLFAYSCSVFAVENTPQYEQANHNPQGVESSIDDDSNENDINVEVPKKPTVLDSWGKVVTLKWRSLSRDDAWNIGGSVTLAGVGYYIYSSVNKPGAGGSSTGPQPPHNPFGGNPVGPFGRPNDPNGPNDPNLRFDDPFGRNPIGNGFGAGGNNMQVPQQPNQWQTGRAERDQTLRRMQEQLQQQQELLRQLQQQEDDEYAEAVRQSLQESEKNKNPFSTVLVQEKPSHKLAEDPVQEKECDICFETKKINEYTVMPCCQYSSCTECLMDHLSSNFDENSTENLKCPNRDCERKIEQPVMAVITGRKNRAIYIRYTEVALKEFLAKDITLKQCPTPDCPNQFEPDQNRKQIYTCEACHQKYCSHCLVNHDVRTMTCEQAKREHELATNPDLADEETQKWIAANTKACPQCKVPVEKNRGCNHMTCKQCKYQFCWTCGGVYGNGGCSSSGCATLNIHTGYDF